MPSINLEDTAKQKIAASVRELYKFFSRVWAVNNTLHLLYNLLETEEVRIAEPSSAIEICMFQLDYIYKNSATELDTILECTGLEYTSYL